jgi:AcrR family transcriptional regulator
MSTAKARARGRPRSREKARQIMNSAMELFTSKGYEGTSIDDIAAAAGVSRQTVYTHYGCKENLFGLAVSTKCKTSGIDPDAIDSETPPEVMIPVIARRFLELITSPEAVKVHAVCTGSAETHPELGQVYFDRGPATTVDIVAAYLADQDRAGRLRVENPEQAAWQLLCMLKAEAQLRTQFNLERQADSKVEAYIDSCVAMFLRAYAPA